MTTPTTINWTQNPRFRHYLYGEPGGYVIDVRRSNVGTFIHCNVCCRELPIGYLKQIAVDLPSIAEAKAFAERHAASIGDRK